jgi:hypothetical protein
MIGMSIVTSFIVAVLAVSLCYSEARTLTSADVATIKASITTVSSLITFVCFLLLICTTCNFRLLVWKLRMAPIATEPCQHVPWAITSVP